MITNLKQFYLRVFLGASLLGVMGDAFSSDDPIKTGDIYATASGNAKVIGHASHVTTDNLTQNQGGRGGDNHIIITTPFSGPSAHVPLEREKKAYEYFAQAESLTKVDPPNWEEALRIYIYAASAEPPHMLACIRCAEYYQIQEPPKVPEALHYYTRALSAQGVREDAYRGLMKLHHGVGITSHREATKKINLEKAKEYGDQITIPTEADENILDDIDSRLKVVVVPAASEIDSTASKLSEAKITSPSKGSAAPGKAESVSSIVEAVGRPLRGGPAIPEIARGYEEIYLRFLNGKLVYRPNEGSDVGKIELPIAALANPLEGTFDLRSCGDAGNYLSISTGYRKGKKEANRNKVEVWFAPRFLIEREIGTRAGHFREILTDAKWPRTAEIGIFWTWGGWDNLNSYDYLTTNTIDQLGDNNLYNKRITTALTRRTDIASPSRISSRSGHFHVIFELNRV